MLREVVGTFLDSLTEREFDSPLLALLASQGFTDIHFTHGAFEFGKDVIAKRVDLGTGMQSQYAIQSKAGDLNLGAWREVRPQLDEAEYNTLSHPGYDETLPRVAVLLTTGRLKGAAGVDAQEYKASVRARGLARFEVWERPQLLDWLCADPSIGLIGSETGTDLLTLIADIRSKRISEPRIERYTREWLPTPADQAYHTRSAIEAALITNSLRRARRLDLAALTALHLFRAASGDLIEVDSPSEADGGAVRRSTRDAARRLFAHYALEILDQVEPLLDEPRNLLGAMLDAVSIVTYPAACSRLLEILALLGLCGDHGDTDRVQRAVRKLASEHPGAHRPPSDQFAVSVIPAVIVLARSDPDAARAFLKDVVTWLLDRHDPAQSGLGLGSMDEPEYVVAQRLVGGALETTGLDVRLSSYLATVLLDLCVVLGASDLFEALLANIRALRIVPCLTAADERLARWRRGGTHVHFHPRVDYGPWAATRPPHHGWVSLLDPRDSLLLSAVCRSRHNVQSVASWIAEPQARLDLN